MGKRERIVDFVVECGFIDVAVRVDPRNGLVSRVELFPVGAAAASNGTIPAEFADLPSEIAEFAGSGGKNDLPLAPLDLSLLSPFAERVLRAARDKIPPGRVAAYGELAAMAGAPNAARAVGRVMSMNPFPLFFPCHRIVAQNGLGGFQSGGDAAALELKRRLLRGEGCFFPAGAV